MTRSIGKLISQFLLLLGPMLTVGWSFLDFVGVPSDGPGTVTVSVPGFPLSGPKQEVEMTLRIMVSVMGFGLLVAYELIDVTWPRRDLMEFRTVYLNREKGKWRGDSENNIPKDVRISIMHVRRPWYVLWTINRFFWTWNDGFEPPNQKGANMVLFTFQGAAGEAYRAKAVHTANYLEVPPPKAEFADYKRPLFITGGIVLLNAALAAVFPSAFGTVFLPIIVVAISVLAVLVLRKNEYRLWPWQLNDAADVKYILCIPMFRVKTKGENKSFQCVGVITLDTRSDAGGLFLQQNQDRLIVYFLDKGKVIACLR